MSDLVLKAQAGDTSAFEQLYRGNVGRIYGLCLRMVNNAERAEVLTQDVFVRAWQRLSSFRGDSAFSSWLHRLAINVVLVDERTLKRRNNRFRSTDQIEQFDRVASSSSIQAAMDLETGIAQLPPRARAVLILHDVEGYKHQEIGEILDIATGTSKAHLHRARQLLITMLSR